MKKKYLLLFFLQTTFSFSVSAINVGEVTSMMPPNKHSISKEIINNTDTARYISVNIERISSPMAEGVTIPMESKSELLSTPASLILPGNSKDNFRFFYKGTKDNIERYYRLSWTDEPVTEFDKLKSNKVGQATTSAIISTILVVAPREEHFDFKRYGENITNTGNSTFRVVSYGPCRDKTKDLGHGCRERYYVKPGVTVKIKYTDLTNSRTRIGIWHGEQFINAN
ncbi:hypothetical protein [Klebsiella sp. S69]|uniref:EcpB family pilus assembly chaperone n=1 Tax=Klebsiella sp. S69 TaxID=2767439 RepID=UPI0019059BE4|nr:hypothetical protein [Klebsiella sp. S69]MBK0167384.1 hypothetical protein [Klebsiella sp. S69]